MVEHPGCIIYAEDLLHGFQKHAAYWHMIVVLIWYIYYWRVIKVVLSTSWQYTFPAWRIILKTLVHRSIHKMHTGGALILLVKVLMAK